jgi:hypothetical protein
MPVQDPCWPTNPLPPPYTRASTITPARTGYSITVAVSSTLPARVRTHTLTPAAAATSALYCTRRLLLP